MAANQRFDHLKRQIDRLRKDSLEVVANANKIVYNGVQKLADKELKALNDYYKSAVASIRTASKGESVKDVAQKQFDLLQDTVNQVIGHARGSVGILGEARAELAKLIQSSASGASVAEASLKKATAPAKKALAKTRSSAQDATRRANRFVAAGKKKARKEVKKATNTVNKDARKLRKAAKNAQAAVGATGKTVTGEAKVGLDAAKKAVSRVLPAPSPNSRASLATSRAKKAVTRAVESATKTVGDVVTSVVETVKSQG